MKLLKEEIVNYYLRGIQESELKEDVADAVFSDDGIKNMARGGMLAIGAVVYGTAKLAGAIYKRVISASGRACKPFIKDKKKFKICRLKYEKDGLMKATQKLKSGMSQCNRVDKAKKQQCIEKLKSSIQKNMMKIEALDDQIKSLS